MSEGQSKGLTKGGAIIGGREVESDRAWHRANDLNREMMRLPIDERRKRWKEYYTLLGELTKR